MRRPVAARLVREWCRRNNVPYCELAASLGISKAQLSGYLNQHRCPGVRRACEIEALTGVPVQAWSVYEDPQTPAKYPFRSLTRAAKTFWAAVS